jgi:predicted MPP superfamily phosphohydrolase
MVDGIVKYLKTPEWRRQHRWRKAIWTTMSRIGLTGAHALPMNRRWVEIHRRKMPLERLDPSFVGMKIVQISDLHYSPVVWQRYLIQYLRWVNDLDPDLVVVTGDLITGGYRFAHRIATILSHLHAKNGVICTFGNHDYSIYGRNLSLEGKRRADYLEKCLEDRGLIVLRNEVHTVQRNGSVAPLVIVGLDDEWSGHIDPDRAFQKVDPNSPIICLNHNPANAKELLKYPWQWMLAGHTHGRQVATSKIGKALYPHRYRHYTHGYYAVEGRHLYVNKGLSYGQRVLDWCRPEVTVFKLTAAPQDVPISQEPSVPSESARLH